MTEPASRWYFEDLVAATIRGLARNRQVLFRYAPVSAKRTTSLRTLLLVLQNLTVKRVTIGEEVLKNNLSRTSYHTAPCLKSHSHTSPSLPDWDWTSFGGELEVKSAAVATRQPEVHV